VGEDFVCKIIASLLPHWNWQKTQLLGLIDSTQFWVQQDFGIETSIGIGYKLLREPSEYPSFNWKLQAFLYSPKKYSTNILPILLQVL
jgi:hypothetical protein